MTLEQLLDAGWACHDTQGERLAGELEAAADAGVPAEWVAPFVKLAIHTIGEHLGAWPRALALGRRVLDMHAPRADTLPAVEALYIASVLAADAVGAAELELAALAGATDPMASLLGMRFGLVGALAGAGRFGEAGRLLHGTSIMADRSAGAPSRALAVATNNLAWALLELPARRPEEDALMQRAGELSLGAWRRAGDWINEELALYLNASVAHARGDSEGALALALAGLDVIAAHGRRPLDAARLHLLRAQALAVLGDAPGRDDALAEADRTAQEIALDPLRRQFAADRARAATAAGLPGARGRSRTGMRPRGRGGF